MGGQNFYIHAEKKKIQSMNIKSYQIDDGQRGWCVYERLSKNKSRLLLCFNEICFLNIIVMGFFFWDFLLCGWYAQNLERFF